MAVKFDSGKIRLWKTGEGSEKLGIGIKFGEDATKSELKQVFEAIRAILTLKYGEGKE